MLSWFRRTLSRDTLQLVGPILVEQTFVMLMGTVNSIMASSIGENAMSAIGLVDSLNNLVITFFSALSVGATVVVAHFSARQEQAKANETVKQSLYASLALVVIAMVPLLIFRGNVLHLFGRLEPTVMESAVTYLTCAVLSYPFVAITGIAGGVMRGARDARTPMTISVLMNIVNVIASFVLIYGVEINGMVIGRMGILGAGLGILIARGVGAALAVYTLVRGTRGVRLVRPLHFKIDIGIQKSVFGIGLPATMENLLFHVGRIVTQTFIVAAGTIDLAANYLTGPVSNIVNLPGNALAIACATLVGQAMGIGDRETAKATMRDMLSLAMLAMGFLCGMLVVFAKPFLSLYRATPAVMPIALFYIRTTAIATPIFWPASFLLPSGLRSSGDARFCMVVSVSTLWIVRIGVGYVLAVVYGMGAMGVWIGMYADWVARGTIYFFRSRGEKWGRKQIIYDE